eukprot:524145-Hanusia_phi.AAC.1
MEELHTPLHQLASPPLHFTCSPGQVHPSCDLISRTAPADPRADGPGVGYGIIISRSGGNGFNGTPLQAESPCCSTGRAVEPFGTLSPAALSCVTTGTRR